MLRIIRHLVAVGVFTEAPDGTVEPTAVGRLLAEDHPAQQRAWFDLTNAVSRADLAFFRLLDAVRTGRPSYETVYGRSFYDDLTAQPELAESFDELMACDQDVVYDEPAAAYDWSGVKHVMDVGGGVGGFLAAIARDRAARHRHPRRTAAAGGPGPGELRGGRSRRSAGRGGR
ncbi:methyltransferase [Micromonospora sp. BRA006-A]|nr:methyltransferase [Micromonospora sp. BRA006-A]